MGHHRFDLDDRFVSSDRFTNCCPLRHSLRPRKCAHARATRGRRRRGRERRDIHIAYQPTLRDKFAAGAAILECPTWSSCYGLPLTTKLCLPASLYCWTRCIEASYFFLRKRMIRGKIFARSKSNIVIGRCRTFAAEYLEIELATRQELLQLPLQLRLLLPFPPPCCVRDKMNTSDLNL